MANDSNPEISEAQMTQKVQPGVDYQRIIDNEVERSQVEVSLQYVAQMSTLSPEAAWIGAISNQGEAKLNTQERASYEAAIKQSIVRTVRGGQIGCMDGRGTDELLLPAPKTAGGTIGNAMRIYLASNASGKAISFNEALEISEGIDTALGFVSGGHQLGQCGAFKHGQTGIAAYATQPEIVAAASKNMLGAFGLEFSSTLQKDLERSARTLPSLPTETQASARMNDNNPHSCPILNDVHTERSLVAFVDDYDYTLDNNVLIAATKKTTGKELQAFTYSWGYHLAIAQQLGGTLAEYYLQTTTGQDTTVLPQLTDGSLDIIVASATQ